MNQLAGSGLQTLKLQCPSLQSCLRPMSAISPKPFCNPDNGNREGYAFEAFPMSKVKSQITTVLQGHDKMAAPSSKHVSNASTTIWVSTLSFPVLPHPACCSF